MKWIEFPFKCEQLGYFSPNAVYDILLEHKQRETSSKKCHICGKPADVIKPTCTACELASAGIV